MNHPRRDELGELVEASAWLLSVLGHVGAVNAPDAWIGAGVIRDLVWDQRFGRGFDPSKVRDVDVPYFDLADLSPRRDRAVEEALQERDRTVPWDAKNQAAVHLWYPDRFGVTVDPLGSVADAVATWPETATCVAIRLSTGGELEILAPYGLDDLLDGVWRPNPKRVTEREARRRLLRKDPARRWPAVHVVGSPG